MEICKPVLPEVVYLVYIVLAKYSLGVISWLLGCDQLVNTSLGRLAFKGDPSPQFYSHCLTAVSFFLYPCQKSNSLGVFSSVTTTSETAPSGHVHIIKSFRASRSWFGCVFEPEPGIKFSTNPSSINSCQRLNSSPHKIWRRTWWHYGDIFGDFKGSKDERLIGDSIKCRHPEKLESQDEFKKIRSFEVSSNVSHGRWSNSIQQEILENFTQSNKWSFAEWLDTLPETNSSPLKMM